MFQFIKFAFVGAINTAVDLAALNALILIFGVGVHGEFFPLFKAVSFFAAVCNSYFLNKYWVFRSAAHARGREQIFFILISLFSFICNVGIAHLAFQFLRAWGGIPAHIAANIAALVGTAVVFITNFVGYKFLVFKKNTYE